MGSIVNRYKDPYLTTSIFRGSICCWQEVLAKLNKTFKVSGIPSLIILDSNGKLITKEGRQAVSKDPQGHEMPWQLGFSWMAGRMPKFDFDQLHRNCYVGFHRFHVWDHIQKQHETAKELYHIEKHHVCRGTDVGCWGFLPNPKIWSKRLPWPVQQEQWPWVRLRYFLEDADGCRMFQMFQVSVVLEMCFFFCDFSKTIWKMPPSKELL